MDEQPKRDLQEMISRLCTPYGWMSPETRQILAPFLMMEEIKAKLIGNINKPLYISMFQTSIHQQIESLTNVNKKLEEAIQIATELEAEKYVTSEENEEEQANLYFTKADIEVVWDNYSKRLNTIPWEQLTKKQQRRAEKQIISELIRLTLDDLDYSRENQLFHSILNLNEEFLTKNME